jgi:SAM-dependent methyltransferase
MNGTYDNPKYYEIAFAFRGIPAEVDVFEACMQRLSPVPVQRVLEVACGPSEHMLEFVRRGYRYTGLDINEHMLEYSRAKAHRSGLEATFLQADMADFSLDAPVDFAFVTLGSFYLDSTAAVLSHLDAMGRALVPGGLYVLQWCINYHWDQGVMDKAQWQATRDDITVDVTSHYEKLIDRTEQVYQFRLHLDVDDGGTRHALDDVSPMRIVFPQEFRLLLEKQGDFEYLGWWNNNDLEEPSPKLDPPDWPMTIIRRKQRCRTASLVSK